MCAREATVSAHIASQQRGSRLGRVDGTINRETLLGKHRTVEKYLRRPATENTWFVNNVTGTVVVASQDVTNNKAKQYCVHPPELCLIYALK